ncbi:hypothetical protein TeGR_g4945 [Tetraparma gracilis]|uniref:Uncharacterized protein n=1 Tax=Tetraparma gracilis TaxID=2962635 RepID=A0ABQ6N5J0_9STRA|nr:hypothetical protein TeGR_g4945 [Tetraparma gracilis]
MAEEGERVSTASTDSSPGRRSSAAEIDTSTVRAARRKSMENEAGMLRAAKESVLLDVKKEIREQLKSKSGEWWDHFNTIGTTQLLEEKAASLASKLDAHRKAEEQAATDASRVKDETEKLVAAGLDSLNAALKSAAEVTLSNNKQVEQVVQLFQGHMEETKKMLGKGLSPNSITDTDIKLLGPRLKAISDAFIKNTGDRDKAIEKAELAFQSKVEEMGAAFEKEKTAQASKYEAKLEMLEKSVVEERERAATDLEKERAQHTEQMKEMEEAMEGKMKTALESYMKNEEAFKLKQQTILSALKKSVSMEQDDHMQRSLDSMEKGAKDAIIRQRKEADAEKRAAETATKKFDKMVEDIRAKWALEEEKRNASLEGRVRAECSIEVKGLKAELAVANKTAQEVQAKFAQLFEKASDDHHDGLKAFAEKSRKTYDERLVGLTTKMEKHFNMYEKQLLEADKDLTTQTMAFEERLHAMKLACNEWKDDYQNQMDTKHAEAVTSLENKYVVEVDKLLDRIAELQKQVRDERKIAPESSRARMDGILSSVIKMRKALDLNSNELISLLMKLLQHAEFCPRLLETYSQLELKLTDQLPIKRMVTRREFVKYRLEVIKRFGANAQTTGGGSAEELEDELRNLDSTMVKTLNKYEGDHNLPFIYEGRIYREVLEEEKAQRIISVSM